jgi:hypothetical protein
MARSLAAAAAALVLALAGAVGSAAAAAPARSVAVSVDASHPGPPVPASFIGLSFEVKDLPQIAGDASVGNLGTLMRSLGEGTLRFGGLTADRDAAWTPAGSLPPPWAGTAITALDFAQLARLTQATGWRVLLTTNLGHFDPVAAGQETAAAQAALGGSLAAVEIGNEPDRLLIDLLRPPPWDFPHFQVQSDAYRSAIGAAAPGVALAGPDVSSGMAGLAWLVSEAATESPVLLTAHYYPLRNCIGCNPLLRDLVSSAMHRREDGVLKALAGISATAGIPLRIDETNNISGGGRAGVSNRFGSSLWAVDFLARAMVAHVAGVDFHGNPANPGGYGPLAARKHADIAAGRLHAQPEWYGLLMARRLLGDRPVSATVRAGGLPVNAYALITPAHDVHILLVNDATANMRPVVVNLPRPTRYRDGSVLRLTAPSLGASGGIELGGQAVAADGTWRPRAGLPGVSARGGTLSVSLPPDSAALVTLHRSH